MFCRMEGGGDRRPGAVGPPRLGADPTAGRAPTGPGGRCRPRRHGRGQPLVPDHPLARGDCADRMGCVQLGFDGHPQGDRAEGSRRLPALDQRHLVRRGLLRSDVEAPVGAVPGAALPHQRLHGLPHPAGRRPDRADGAVQCPAGAGPHRAARHHRVHRRHAHAPASGPGSRDRGPRPLQPELGPAGRRTPSGLVGPILDRPGRARELLHVLRRLRDDRDRGLSRGRMAGPPGHARSGDGGDRSARARSCRRAAAGL